MPSLVVFVPIHSSTLYFFPVDDGYLIRREDIGHLLRIVVFKNGGEACTCHIKFIHTRPDDDPSASMPGRIIFSRRPGKCIEMGDIDGIAAHLQRIVPMQMIEKKSFH